MTIADEQISRVTSKGQVLLHKTVRDRLGIVPGSQVRVGRNDAGQAVIEPLAARPDDPDARERRVRAAIARIAGKFATGRSTDEQMRDLRGDPEL